MSANDPFRRRRAIETRASRDAEYHPHTPLGTGGEFDAIRRMLERWGPRARRIGDDAAVVTKELAGTPNLARLESCMPVPGEHGDAES